MLFIITVPILLIVSFLWSLWSLKREFKKPKEIELVKNELKKEKILFQLK